MRDRDVYDRDTDERETYEAYGRDRDAAAPPSPANAAVPLTEEKVGALRRATAWVVAKESLYVAVTVVVIVFVARFFAGGWLWPLLGDALRSLGAAAAAGNADALSTPATVFGIAAGGILLLFALIAGGFAVRHGAQAVGAVRDLRRDERDGTCLVATGPFSVSERRIGTGENRRRYWTLTLHDCAFPIPRRVFEALRTHQRGAVAYSRYSRHVIEVRDPDGYSIYSAPGYDAPIH